MIPHSLFSQVFFAPPRKEGRSHPQKLGSAQGQRRIFVSAFLFLVLILAAFYLLHHSWASPHGAHHAGPNSAEARPHNPAAHSTSSADDMGSSPFEEIALSQAPLSLAKKSHQLERHNYLHHVRALVPENDKVDEQHQVEAHMPAPTRPNNGFDTPIIAQHSNEAHYQHQFDRHVQAAAHQDDTAEEWNRFDQAFQRVISLLPDELYMRELLRPFEGTGEQKLRDIGLRARAFKTFFEAWEALHLVWKDGVAYPRQDVVQYLYVHHDMENLAQTIRDYESFRHFFQHFSSLLFPWTAPYFPDHLSLHAYIRAGGRGIVLTAGDRQASYLLASIPSFRQLGCTLPIEIMYLGEADLSQDYRAELESLPGVITRDLSQMVADEGWTLAGWAAKPFAMLLSSFQEVIFIDADSLFFINPTLLFNEPSYVESGALFFRDRLLMPESKKRWLQEILARPVSKQVIQSRLWRGESAHMQESGVLVVDKWRHFVALLMVTRMNGPDRDGNEDEGSIGVYDMVYGDKETFWIGWELVGDREYGFHAGDAGIMGILEEEDSPEESDETSGENNEEGADDTTSEESEENQEVDQAQTSEEDEAETVFERSEEIDYQQVEASEPDQEIAPPGKYTVCAPQLLHLDTNGRPLWFNGWVLDNKFSKDKSFGRFEFYMKEPREIQEPGAWEIGEDNMCCLTTDDVFTFTEGEKDVLDMIIGLAKSIPEHAQG